MDLSLLDRHATGTHDKLRRQQGPPTRPVLRQPRGSSSAGVHAAAAHLATGAGPLMAAWSSPPLRVCCSLI